MTSSSFCRNLELRQFDQAFPANEPHNQPLFVLRNCPPEQVWNNFHCFSVPTTCLQRLVCFHLPIPHSICIQLWTF